MYRRLTCLLLSAALAAGLLACGRSSTPGPSSAERATRLAQTAAALLTSTAQASITPVTPTSPPTATPVPPTPTLTPPPTDTAIPATPTAPPPTPCPGANDSEFVSDITIPDGTHFAPGAAFTKTWRLRNDGECAWTAAYELRPVGGELMGGAPVSLTAEVPPGESLDISVPLVAPPTNGTHRGSWQLHSPAGEPFGARPYVEIIVP
jgi:hypothetical protein